jgi:hypothetical protein
MNAGAQQLVHRRPEVETRSVVSSTGSNGGEGTGDRGEGAVDEAVVGPLAALLAGDEAGFDELPHVVGDGGLG